jgi:hypothetical protein
MKKLLITALFLLWCNNAVAQSYIVYDTTSLPTTGTTLFSGLTIFQPFCINQRTAISQIELHAFVPNSPPAQLFLKVYDENYNVEKTFNHVKEKETWLYLYEDLNFTLNPGKYFLGVSSNKDGLLWRNTLEGQKAKITGDVIPIPEPSSYILILVAGIFWALVKQW